MAKKGKKKNALIKSKSKNSVGQKVLSSNEKIQVCLWLAEFKTPDEIVLLIKKHFNKDITAPSVHAYRTSEVWEKIIQESRKKFLAAIQNEAIAHKRIRLQRADRVYQESMRPEIKRYDVLPDGYETQKKKNSKGKEYTVLVEKKKIVPIFEIKPGPAISALRHALEEVEGRRPNVQAFTQVNIVYGYRRNRNNDRTRCPNSAVRSK